MIAGTGCAADSHRLGDRGHELPALAEGHSDWLGAHTTLANLGDFSSPTSDDHKCGCQHVLARCVNCILSNRENQSIVSITEQNRIPKATQNIQEVILDIREIVCNQTITWKQFKKESMRTAQEKTESSCQNESTETCPRWRRCCARKARTRPPAGGRCPKTRPKTAKQPADVL